MDKKLLVLIPVVIILLIVFYAFMEFSGDDGSKEQTKDNGIEKTQVKNVTVSGALNLINNNSGNPDFVILDVRTQDEYDEGHISNATMLDFYSDTFESDLDKLDKTKTYLVYCRTGSRSARATGMMIDLGFSDVYNMLGGIVQWELSSYPTVTG